MDDAKTVTSVKSLPSIFESMVEIRFLLLLLCFAFYLDAWFISFQIDPTNLSVGQAYKGLLTTSILTIILFIGSYSLLMIGLFPVLRKVLAHSILYIKSSVQISNHSTEEKQLSDWSAAFVCLSLYSAVVGFFSQNVEYKGLSNYIFNILQSNDFSEFIFRVCAIFFWLYCFSLATDVDDPFLK